MKNTATGEQHPSTRRYRGVRLRKWGSWVAEVRFPNSRERLWLGSYPTPEQAARAFDAAVYCLRGPGAALNFPEQPPHIPSASTLNREEIRAAAVRFAHDVPRRAEEAQGGGGEATTGVVSPGEANSRAMAESMEVFPAFYFPGVSGWSNEEEEDVWAAAATASIDDIYRSSPLWNF
ncbi:ethylene-responsive transcription factor ERF017-like [Musa acuminata AAA Group]|uniref:ethylene-responsive transcription factor ERF017-like n=1 Tax=Musa acuminata AAA Group TaxID=214697 RepID=UPI0031CF0DFD